MRYSSISALKFDEQEASALTTHAIIIGIERYAAGPSWNLDGPASDALRFLRYLRTVNVPAENVTALVSALSENEAVIEEIKLLAGNIKEPTAATINDVVTKILPSVTSDFFLFYWAGHGIITVAGERRLFTADATTTDKRNLDLNDLMACLRTHIYPGLNRQAIIVDTCANYVHNPTVSLPATQFPKGNGLASREQFALLAAAPGEYAKNLNAEKSGLLSRELMKALNDARERAGPLKKWPPDLPAIAQQLIDQFLALRRMGEARQTPTTLKFRDWSGSEQNLSQVSESAPSRSQTDRKEPQELEFEQKRILTEALLGCATVSNPQSRDAVLAQVRSEISDAISRSPIGRIDVMGIVTTACNYSGGLQELLEIVYAFEGNSKPWQKVEKAAAEILPNFCSPSR